MPAIESDAVAKALLRGKDRARRQADAFGQGLAVERQAVHLGRQFEPEKVAALGPAGVGVGGKVAPRRGQHGLALAVEPLELPQKTATRDGGDEVRYVASIVSGVRLALVDDMPGVTRDRREGEGRLFDLEFTVIDTAGAELTNNAAGMAGVAYSAKILPVRVLGHCGGYDSDIADVPLAELPTVLGNLVGGLTFVGATLYSTHYKTAPKRKVS